MSFSALYDKSNSRAVNAAAVSIWKARSQGKTHNGCPFWTKSEENLLLKHYPDYSLLCILLPRRTRNAIIHHAIRIVPHVKKRRFWSDEDVRVLRKHYSYSSPEVLMAMLPFVKNYSWILCKAHRLGLRKKRVRACTGHSLTDALKKRCKEIGYTMRDLDYIAKTKKFFQHHAGARVLISVGRVIRAIRALDGRIRADGRVEWGY